MAKQVVLAPLRVAAKRLAWMRSGRRFICRGNTIYGDSFMVHASHVIFGAYGFWLPNDPRGSWSDFVGAWELFRFGPATKTCETRSLAARPHDQAQRLATKAALRRPAVEFSGNQARAIGQGFAEYAARSSVDILACAILPDHIHLVLRRHRLSVEKLVIQLKGAATRRLVDEGVHPFQDRTNSARPAKCFAQGEWKVFLDSEQDIDRAIRYVEKNPLKEGKSRQCWSFVTGCGTAVIARSAGQSRSAARRG